MSTSAVSSTVAERIKRGTATTAAGFRNRESKSSTWLLPQKNYCFLFTGTERFKCRLLRSSNNKNGVRITLEIVVQPVCIIGTSYGSGVYLSISRNSFKPRPLHLFLLGPKSSCFAIRLYHLSSCRVEFSFLLLRCPGLVSVCLGLSNRKAISSMCSIGDVQCLRFTASSSIPNPELFSSFCRNANLVQQYPSSQLS